MQIQKEDSTAKETFNDQQENHRNIENLPSNKPENQTSKRSIKYVTPKFKIHCFQATVGESIIQIDVIKMIDSLIVWIGNQKAPEFDDLSLAMTFGGNETTTTQLIGPVCSSTSMNLASRLSKRLKKQIYVSCNIDVDRFTLPMFEKCFANEIKNYPEAF